MVTPKNIACVGIVPSMIFDPNADVCILDIDPENLRMVDDGCGECRSLDNRREYAKDQSKKFTCCTCDCHS